MKRLSATMLALGLVAAVGTASAQTYGGYSNGGYNNNGQYTDTNAIMTSLVGALLSSLRDGDDSAFQGS